ncbi:nitrous oxide-stimulated promoter family protein [Endozoicomonas ascidiicola]|uniref:nitrous oxide-stimulated promoter family protein n=1 Tax=Endozoicomonas ascidiicola TaxID=1698521 RepID=UPI00082C9146|nr:nitrous oxide-stimulated promoter family protein [Endozoicomonas ascidiicola]
MPLTLDGPLKDHPRLAREYITVSHMIELYCQHHHKHRTLCNECLSLLAFSKKRLERCVYGDDKPTCVNCKVHCYKANQQDKIREVMKWAGPRMLFKHPVLAIKHVLDGRKPIPKHPKDSRHSAA